MKKLFILIFTMYYLMAFSQIKDSTDVAIDTSFATVSKTKIEVVKQSGSFFIKQYNGNKAFTQVTLDNKKDAINALTDMLKRVKTDEANLLRELAITRARKVEIKTAINSYK